MYYSRVSEIFKIGIGPSSSHTLGPWRICLDICQRLEESNQIQEVKEVLVHLYGSLAKTGAGHCTPMGCIMGLQGYIPKDTDPDIIDKTFEEIEKNGILEFFGKNPIPFTSENNIIFHFDETLKYHSNGMTVEVHFKNGKKSMFTSYSIGGGFFIRDEQKNQENQNTEVTTQYPYDFSYAKDFLNTSIEQNKSLYDLVLENEMVFDKETSFFQNIDSIVQTMLQSAYRGTTLEGLLPGHLKLKRRAKRLNGELLGSKKVSSMEEWHKVMLEDQGDFQKTLKWVSCIAISVNEENAACGRIVTAPTNGSSGTIPAVLHYYLFLLKNNAAKDVYRFISIASLIGSLFRARATISAAEGGCQAEVGVSSAMAAAALTDALGGNIRQTFAAAEIAMEHHLGLTCDPVGGLVQIPCIERNAMGAIKAITSSSIALSRNTLNIMVDLDTVIDAMWETSKAMNSQYKETAEGGLAFVLRNC